jgi:flavin-dependent dehydrogenase
MSLAATLDRTEAAQRTWDVVVVGAGPAGALAARELARRGVPVLLVDRATFPRWKVCGSCLNLRALATLAAVGLGELPARLGAVPLSGLRLAAAGRQALLPLPGGVSLSRTAFDAALVEEAVQAGAAFLPGTRARLGETMSDARLVRLHPDEGGEETWVEARVVVAADGLGGRLAAGEVEAGAEVAAHSRVGAGTVTADVPDFYDRGTIFMGCGTGGYVGLVRLEDGQLAVAAAFDPELLRRVGGLGKAAGHVLTEAGLPLPPGLAHFAWRGTPLLTRRLSHPALERVLVVGDAAGYVEPFTGEGMAWALASGAAAAAVAGRGCRNWRPELMRHWSGLHRRTVARRQWLCRAVAALLRWPLLTRATVGLLGRLPGLVAPLMRCLN